MEDFRGSNSYGTIEKLDKPNTRVKDTTRNPLERSVMCMCTVNALQKNVALVLILYYLSTGITTGAVSALMYEKTCLQNFNSTVCTNLKLPPEAEDVVQTETAELMLWYQLLHYIPSLFTTLLYGSLSDHLSRKATIAIPIFGNCVRGIIYILSAVYMRASPRWLLLGSFSVSITGGWVTLLMGVYSYIGVISNSNDARTRNIVIAEGVSAVATAIADAASGVFLDNTSYITVFSVGTGISLLSLLFATLIIQNPEGVSLKTSQNIDHLSGVNVKEKIRMMIKNVFRTMIHSLGCVFKRRERNLRLQIMACLGIVFGSMITSKANRVEYLFFRRHPLNWSQTTYGLFSAVHHILPGMALMILVPPLRRKFKLRETTLIALGIASKGFSELFLAFSSKTWMVFIVPLIGIFTDAIWIVRSTISGLVQTDELGGIFAVLGSVQSVTGVVGSIMYNNIYPATLDIWPGFVFAMSASVAFITFLLNCWLGHCLKNQPGEVYESLPTNDLQEAEEEESSDHSLLDKENSKENANLEDDTKIP